MVISTLYLLATTTELVDFVRWVDNYCKDIPNEEQIFGIVFRLCIMFGLFVFTTGNLVKELFF